jgi:hypothetical protein
MMKTKIAAALIAVLICAAIPIIAADAPKETLDPRFEQADFNKDGKIDQAEFVRYLALLDKLKLKKPVKVIAPLTETEKLYGKKGSYMESALGVSIVPVKLTTETVVEKKGGCCGGKKTEEAVVEKKGGCCGGKTETASTESGGSCCGRK